MFSKNPSLRATVLLLAAVLLMGLGRVLLLPPFAAADETAHYSRLEATAFAKNGETRYLSADVVAYTQQGPMPAHWIATQAFNTAHGAALATGQPLNLAAAAAGQHYIDYRAFFADTARAQDFAKRYRSDPASMDFRPSKMENWEYQHPPLYYILMAPLLKHMTGAPLILRLLMLRVLSCLPAFAGFGIGLWALARHLDQRGIKGANDIAALGAVYPFLMPAFFVDFARLGNDGLCLLLFGLAWMLVLSHLQEPRNKKVWVLLGIVLGVSLLAKAFMIAIGAGLLLFMLLHAPNEAARRNNLHGRILPCAVAVIIALAIGIWPYLGDGASGSGEISAWLQGRGFSGDGIPWRMVMLNLRYMLTSTVYNFTDSALTGAGEISAAGLLLFVVIVAAGVWAKSLPRDPRGEEWLPLYALAPLAAGLVLHGIFAAIAYRAAGVTPGYYVHVAAPALAFILGAGFRRLLFAGVDRSAAIALFALAAITNAFLILGRLAMFTGCIWLSGAEDRVNIDWGHEACRPGIMYDRLALLAWPAAGLLCLCLSFALFAAGTTMFLRRGADGHALSSLKK